MSVGVPFHRWHQLVEDEKGKLSAGRFGLWVSLALLIECVQVDVLLTILGKADSLPNVVYTTIGGTIAAFGLWAMGKGIAEHAGPALGAIFSRTAAAARRDPRLPSKDDDERDDR